jgi:SAM-dependent methyltransferase
MPIDRADLAALTARQQSMWARGDFNVIALGVVPASEALIASVDPHAGQAVLDVACGSGNAALAAARRYCEVVGLDYVPALLDRARQRAAAEGTTIRFEVGDAQALPFEPATFDVVLSVFGVMFAPDQAKAAQELVRVCRPGGRIGLACWTPDGFAADLFRAHAKHVPVPAGLAPPTRWGTAEGLAELFGDEVEVRTERRFADQYFRDLDHALDMFRLHLGPTSAAFAAVGEAGRDALARDVRAAMEGANIAKDGTVILRGAYLQVIGTKR